MDVRTAKIISILCIAFSVLIFLYELSFYYRDFPSTPIPESGRVYPLNNHGRYTYMSHSEYLQEEICAYAPIPFFAIAFWIDYRYDPFRRRR